MATTIKRKRKRNLTPECVRRIRRMIEGIVAQPTLYDQNLFPDAHAKNVCDTPGCAAGQAVWNDTSKAEFKKFMAKILEIQKADEDIFKIWSARAAEALKLPKTITVNDYPRLFGGSSSWPKPFWQVYKSAKERRDYVGMAAACAARWEYFIATDGKDGPDYFLTS